MTRYIKSNNHAIMENCVHYAYRLIKKERGTRKIYKGSAARKKTKALSA